MGRGFIPGFEEPVALIAVAEKGALNVELTAKDAVEYARMWALLGNAESSLLLLKNAFEKTPAQALPFLKTRVRGHPDLASLTAQPTYEQIMATESKLPQTCSGGSSCAGCPNRGKCGGG